MIGVRFSSLAIAGVLSVCTTAATAKGQTTGLASVLRQNGYRAVPLHHSPDKGFTLSAKINGKPARLAVSMASPLSAFFRGANGAFGIRERKSGSYINSALGPSREEYGLASGNSIELANMVMPATTFVVLNQESTPAARWRDIAGLLGEAELNRLAAILDCGNARLYVRPAGRDGRVSDTIGKVLAGRGFTAVPMRVNTWHHFEVPCRVNSYQSVITIEPVNSITTLSDRVASAGRVPVVATTGRLSGVGGVSQPHKSGKVAQLGIGSFLIPNATVSVARATFSVLGFDQLDKGSAVIDLGARKLYLHGRPIRAVN
jgi:hypothetical protein